jgi:thioredoxin-like negative regulator of GroEL
MTALAFAALLNFALATSFVGPDLWGSLLGRVAWLIVAAFWAAGAWRNLRQLPQLLAPESPKAAADLFPQAQAEYLRGHWFEAEALLARQLRTSPEDAEARLLLVTLERRTGRWDDAQRELRRLKQCEAASKWQLEIEREETLLGDRRRQAEGPSETNATDDHPQQQTARAA